MSNNTQAKELFARPHGKADAGASSRSNGEASTGARFLITRLRVSHHFPLSTCPGPRRTRNRFDLWHDRDRFIPMLRSRLFIRFGVAAVLGGLLVRAQAPRPPAAQYDEAKVPAYTLPDPLLLADGHRVTSRKTWERVRRPEILDLFATHVYGRTPVGRPAAMRWAVSSSTRTPGADGAPATLHKTVVIYFAGTKDGPQMTLSLALPAGKRAPVFLMPSPAAWALHGFGPNQALLLRRGYGLATFDPNQVELDKPEGYATSVRAFFAKPGGLAPDAWGAIGAWAWAMSRAMDYLVTAPNVDSRKVAILGVSRYGKTTMWAGAQDQRFSMVFSVESGCAGAGIVRRQYGETVASITRAFPYWFNPAFKTYATRVNDLPVDWHMLVALMAPRPVYVSTAVEDRWGDPRGSFLAARGADPVYRLYHETGVGTDTMPPVLTPVGDFIGYHERTGKHGINDYDWARFLDFADRHWKTAMRDK